MNLQSPRLLISDMVQPLTSGSSSKQPLILKAGDSVALKNHRIKLSFQGGPKSSAVQYSSEPILTAKDLAPVLNAKAEHIRVYNPSIAPGLRDSEQWIIFRAARLMDKSETSQAPNPLRERIANCVRQIAKRFPEVRNIFPASIRRNFMAAVTHAKDISEICVGQIKNGAVEKSTIRKLINSKALPTDLQEKLTGGIHDPRVTKINETYFILCNGVNRAEFKAKKKHNNFLLGGAYPLLFTTQDFKTLEFKGLIGPHDPPIYNKNMMLFPEKIDGKYLLLHRFYPAIRYLKLSEADLQSLSTPETRDKVWKPFLEDDYLEQHTVLKPRSGEKFIGASSVPIKTEKGWLLVYHVVKEEKGREVYYGNVALLDLKEPWKVISTVPGCLFSPRESHNGRILFPSGAVLEGKKGHENLVVYYGAEDEEIRKLTYPLSDLWELLKPVSKDV